MALPTNVIVTPDQSDVGDLPRTVSVTGTDLFERPSYTERELFTQIAPDTLVGDWYAPITGTQNSDGIIGDSFYNNGSQRYLDTTAKLPTITDYIGISIRFKTDGGSTDGGLINFGKSGIPDALEVGLTPEAELEVVIIDSTGVLVKRVETNVGAGHYRDSEWHHAWISWDASVGTNAPVIIMDSVEVPLTIVQNDTFTDIYTPVSSKIGLTGSQGRWWGWICQAYWSTDPDFANHNLKYYNLPIIEVN
jgi:hypothetical protein